MEVLKDEVVGISSPCSKTLVIMGSMSSLSSGLRAVYEGRNGGP